MKPPKIICAVCNRQVDSVTEAHHPFIPRTDFIIECHGEMETFSIDDEALVSASSIRIVERAFEKRKAFPK